MSFARLAARLHRALLISTSAVVATVAVDFPIHAQAAPKSPIRTLAPSTAVSKDSVGPLVAIRELSDGSVMLNDPFTRRVLLFDAKLAGAKVVIDTIGGAEPGAPAKIQQPALTLIPYLGDSTLYADRVSQSLLVLDANGKVARVMSIPRANDIGMMAQWGEAGIPGIDSKGRLIYHGTFSAKPSTRNAEKPWLPPIPQQADSSPVVRADFDTRKVDTLVVLKNSLGAPFKSLEEDSDGNVFMRMYINLLGVDDQFAVLSDGTAAVLSVHDYHLEFADPDRTRRSAPKMPFDWKRLTDADKQRMRDSVAPDLERRNNVAPIRINTPNGPRTGRQVFEFLPNEKFGDYEQPVQTAAMRADRDARLWILPRTSLGAKGGLLYDVINRKGELVERVQFPPGYVLAGFGEKGVVYIMKLEKNRGLLERTTVKLD
ncbi:MAG: hypothetical protein H7Z40_16560 [Phycisphaerae bacterium]|nr:hypothetical protein [Gemmatimonadaceae bacterium]